VVVGAIVATVGVLALVAAFQKLRIQAYLQSGSTIHATFADDYDNLVRPYWTKVEVAGVPVGVVTGLHTTSRGRAEVAMKVNGHALAALGSRPTASIDLLTLLGGNIDVTLHPGGTPGTFHGAIPMGRTTTPVYIGRVLDAFSPQARQGIRTSVDQLEATLANGGSSAAVALLAHAPAALAPTGTVLGAAEGAQPGDLPTLVADLANVAQSLTAQQGELQSILTDTGTVSSALGGQADALGQTVAGLPQDLAVARQGLSNLSDVLVHLQQVAGPLQPSAPLLADLLQQLQPTLQSALPVIQALPQLLTQAAPLLDRLAPTAVSGTALLRDVQGPVLDRVLNPIVPTLLRPYKGSSTAMYQEIGYMLSGLDGIAQMTDANGAMISFQPGVNLESLGGLPFTSPLSNNNSPKG
jgi:phospholipid/cholesterol/gamma-HCH transport system substrate-binding protein